MIRTKHQISGGGDTYWTSNIRWRWYVLNLDGGDIYQTSNIKYQMSDTIQAIRTKHQLSNIRWRWSKIQQRYLDDQLENIQIIQGTLQNRCHLFAKNLFQSKLEFSDAPQRAKIFLWRSSSEAPPQLENLWKTWNLKSIWQLKPSQLENPLKTWNLESKWQLKPPLL